jgi:hypothetical protein
MAARKHDGFRIVARRNGAGVQLITPRRKRFLAPLSFHRNGRQIAAGAVMIDRWWGYRLRPLLREPIPKLSHILQLFFVSQAFGLQKDWRVISVCLSEENGPAALARHFAPWPAGLKVRRLIERKAFKMGFGNPYRRYIFIYGLSGRAWNRKPWWHRTMPKQLSSFSQRLNVRVCVSFCAILPVNCREVPVKWWAL